MCATSLGGAADSELISIDRLFSSKASFWIYHVTMAGISGGGRKELAEVLGGGRRFVETGDVAAALGIDADAAGKRLSRWAEQGWLRKVRRGLYIGVPVDAPNPSAWTEDPLVVAARVWDPCYFTGWTSARHWGLTEQVFRTTVLKTTRRVRRSHESLLDHDYLTAHVAEPLMTWGLTAEWRDGVRLSFANPSRTVVDVLDAPSLGGGLRHVAEVLGAYLDEHDASALLESAVRLDNGAVFKRLGYLLERLHPDQIQLIEACRAHVTAGIVDLDPSGPSGGRRVMRWGVRVNVVIGQEGAS